MTYAALIYKEENLYVAECPEVGSISQGETIEQALENLKEATQLYMEETEYSPRGRFLLTTFDA